MTHSLSTEPLNRGQQLSAQPKIRKKERPRKQFTRSSVLTNRLANSDSLYIVTLNSTTNITTTVTSSSAVVSSWISSILSSPTKIVGLDVEWRPSLVPDQQQHPVSLLQLCLGKKCLVFQLLHCDSIPSSLIALLKNPKFTFLGVGVDEDAKKLVTDYNMEVASTVDLRDLATEKMGRNEVKQMGLKRLACEVLEIDVYKPKQITMSRWDQRCLRLEQIGYAAVDAFLSFEIGRKLYAMRSPTTASTSAP